MVSFICHVNYLQSCFDVFVVVLGSPFPWKSLLLLGAVKCRRLVNTEDKKAVFILGKAFYRIFLFHHQR